MENPPPYLIANQEATSSNGSLSNLYNEEEQTKVNEVQRRQSLVAFEERENKLKRAGLKIDKSKVLKKDENAKSTRSGLRREILASNNAEDLVGPRDKKRFEKALANGKATSKDSKTQGYSSQDNGAPLPTKRTRTTRAVIDSLVRSFSNDALRIHDGGEESDKPVRKGDSSKPPKVSNSSKHSTKPRQ